MPSSQKLTCVDLFAGCGGLSLGLEQAGFTPVLFSEINRFAADTYAINRPGLAVQRVGAISEILGPGVIEGMRLEVEGKAVKRVDLVCGGPPCQGYSGIGHRRSFKVERSDIPSNHLYLDMIEAIKRFKPRMFLFENVRGLMTGRWTADGEPGEIWRDVLAAFEAIPGYRIGSALVQAKNYGVPQNRPRVLIVGIHDDVKWTPDDSMAAVARGLLPKPSINRAPSLVDVLGDLVDVRYPNVRATTEYPRKATSEFQIEMRTILLENRKHILGRGESLTEHEYSMHSAKVMKKFQYMLDHSGEIHSSMRTKKFAQRLLPRHWGKDGPSITATSLPDDFVHYEQPRTPSVREWARIQCFPDYYQFAGKRTTGGQRRAGNPSEGIWDREVPKYTQIGNAVPVRLARAVGEHLRGLLRNR
jgi:DNA (cytosine-5)-methyltransferase 1